MSENFEFTLHSPMTEEDWNILSDVEHEKTKSVTFQTPQGRQVKYIKCEVLDKIRDEVMNLSDGEKPERIWNVDVLQIINKYITEGK